MQTSFVIYDGARVINFLHQTVVQIMLIFKSFPRHTLQHFLDSLGNSRELQLSQLRDERAFGGHHEVHCGLSWVVWQMKSSKCISYCLIVSKNLSTGTYSF